MPPAPEAAVRHIRSGRHAIAGHEMTILDATCSDDIVQVDYRIVPGVHSDSDEPDLTFAWLVALWDEHGEQYPDLGGAFGGGPDATEGSVSVAAPPCGEATVHIARVRREEHLVGDPDWILSIRIGRWAD
jgi:hypothetical protein